MSIRDRGGKAPVRTREFRTACSLHDRGIIVLAEESGWWRASLNDAARVLLLERGDRAFARGGDRWLRVEVKQIATGRACGVREAGRGVPRFYCLPLNDPHVKVAAWFSVHEMRVQAPSGDPPGIVEIMLDAIESKAPQQIERDRRFEADCAKQRAETMERVGRLSQEDVSVILEYCADEDARPDDPPLLGVLRALKGVARAARGMGGICLDAMHGDRCFSCSGCQLITALAACPEV